MNGLTMMAALAVAHSPAAPVRKASRVAGRFAESDEEWIRIMENAFAAAVAY